MHSAFALRHASHVTGARPNQAPAFLLFQRVRQPTGHAAGGEYRQGDIGAQLVGRGDRRERKIEIGLAAALRLNRFDQAFDGR